MKKQRNWNSKSIRELARTNLAQESAWPQNVQENLAERSLELKPEFQWGPFEKSTGDAILIVIAANDPDEGAEMELLCETLQLKNLGFHVLPKHFEPNPATYIGSGTLETLKARMERVGATALALDVPLSAIQVRNMEDVLKMPVLDRQAVILGIFKHHARSKFAKLQVELAQLKYLQPRLSGLWMGLSRQRGGKGGMGGKGLGETRLELDRRVIKERIGTLSSKLEEAKKSFMVQSSRRSELPRVAIVGYTNAGKSSLMKRLTKAPVLSKDELFSTLDTTVRPLNPPTQPRILVSDTVGFVRDLPHELVASFKSTLQEAIESRLLLQVVDSSHPLWREQIETTNAVLEEIGAASLPKIYVFNKMDLLGGVARLRQVQMRRFVNNLDPESIVSPVAMVSTKSGEGLSSLRELILNACSAQVPDWAQTSVPVEE